METSLFSGPEGREIRIMGWRAASPLERRTEMAKKLYRSGSQKMLGGVCGGLAEYFDADVSLVRLVFVGLTLMSAVLPMLLFYIIAWIVIPVGVPVK